MKMKITKRCFGPGKKSLNFMLGKIQPEALCKPAEIRIKVGFYFSAGGFTTSHRPSNCLVFGFYPSLRPTLPPNTSMTSLWKRNIILSTQNDISLCQSYHLSPTHSSFSSGFKLFPNSLHYKCVYRLGTVVTCRSRWTKLLYIGPG